MTTDHKGLAEQLKGRRWFGDGDRSLEQVDIVDEAIIYDGPPSLKVCLARVGFSDGGSDLYHLMLLTEEDGEVLEAFDKPDHLRVVGDLMAHGTTLKGERGIFHYGGPGLDPLSPPGESARPIGTEQSNSSLVLDEEIIIKFFRRVEVGSNPDLEINRLLTNEGFEHIPPQVGEIIYESTDEDETSIDLGIAQRFMADAEEGWTYVLKRLGELYDEIHPLDVDEDRSVLVAERATEVLERLEGLGNATAQMHIVLAREEIEPSFTPEPIEKEEIRVWMDELHSALKKLLRSDVYGLGRVEEAIDAQIERLKGLPDDLGMKIRVHGDYHLGQVLLVPRNWLIIDFEGEPLRPIEERREKRSPLRDVAGMLRSINYAALAVLFEKAEPESKEWRKLEPWAETWEDLARERFLTAYLRTSHEGHFLPGDREHLLALLDAFEIDKAIYELDYERQHRPDWVRIPLKGIIRVVERSEKR